MSILNIKKHRADLNNHKVPAISGRSKTLKKDLKTYSQIIRQFTETVANLEEAYSRLQQRVEELTLELRKKSFELRLEKHQKSNIRSFLDYVLLSMNSGVIAIDKEGRITVFNRAAETITGIHRREALGRHYAEVRERLGFSQNPLTALQHTEEYIGLEGRIIQNQASNNGDVRHVRRSVTLIRDNAGRIMGAMEIIEDITEFKRLHKEYQKASNLNALGDMARQFAHKIRNPLGGIMGFAALLKRDFDEEDPRRIYVTKILEGASKLDKYISDLLLFARPMKPKLQRYEIHDLLQKNLRISASRMQQPRRYEFIEHPQPLFLTLDTDLFAEIVSHMQEFLHFWAHKHEPVTVQVQGQPEKHSATISFTFKLINSSHELKLKKEEEATGSFLSQEEGLSLAIVKRLTEILDGVFVISTQQDGFIEIRLIFAMN
ncbi:MAG: PAS domain S-box protein [candidate division KSB1 bacterium]|nr:PAS domain S-box protein [candidate division KSB1 bacterium]